MTTTANRVAHEALAILEREGRTWLQSPTVTANAFGGTDIATAERTYRTAMDDESVELVVLTRVGVICEKARFTEGLALAILPSYLADALR